MKTTDKIQELETNLSIEKKKLYILELKQQRDDLLEVCHNALGAYEALKVAGLDKQLPGYKQCLESLKAAIANCEA